MPKGSNNMDTKSDEHFLVIKATIKTNKQEADKSHKSNDEKLMILTENQKQTNEEIMLLTENLQVFTEMMIDKKNISKSSPAQKDTSTPPDPTTVVPNNNRAPPLEGVISTKIGGMWTLKHEISSPNFYELLIKIELKGDTVLDIKNVFNHIKICLNAVTRLREDLLPDYQSIKRLSKVEEYFVPDRDHHSSSWNVQIHNSLGHSLLVAMTNDTCVKPSMVPQSYKVVITHAHDISVWTILSRLIHSCAPHLVGMNGDVQSDLATLAFKNGEQLEYFHIRILRLQQEIILSGEIVSPTRL